MLTSNNLSGWAAHTENTRQTETLVCREVHSLANTRGSCIKSDPFTTSLSTFFYQHIYFRPNYQNVQWASLCAHVRCSLTTVGTTCSVPLLLLNDRCCISDGRKFVIDSPGNDYSWCQRHCVAAIQHSLSPRARGLKVLTWHCIKQDHVAQFTRFTQKRKKKCLDYTQYDTAELLSGLDL